MGAGDIKDKSMMERLDEIKYKDPVQSKKELSDAKILRWLSNVTYTWEVKPQKTKDIAVIQKYILPVFKKLAKTNPYIIMTLMNTNDFKILLSSTGVRSIDTHGNYYSDFHVSLPGSGDKPYLGIQFNPAKMSSSKVSLDKFQEGLSKEIIEYSDDLFKTPKYQAKVKAQKAEKDKYDKMMQKRRGITEKQVKAKKLTKAQKKLEEALEWRSKLETLPEGSVKDQQLKGMEEGLERLNKEIRDLKKQSE